MDLLIIHHNLTIIYYYKTFNRKGLNHMSQLDSMNMDAVNVANSANSMADASLKQMLPRMAMDYIPEASPDAVKITALVKSGSSVTGYQLSDGRIVSREEGVSLAKAGQIQGVGVAHKKETEYLKSLPDGSDDNNLSHLPTVRG